MQNIQLYDVAEILHIVSVISWLAGLLYLPRIFVYHADVKTGSETDKIFQTMELKLIRFIMLPAMISAFVCGFYMISQIGFGFAWLHIKITLVLGLAGYHGFLSVCRKKFAKGENNRSAKFYRLINEIPAILMIIIVSLVVLKPF